MKEHKPEVETLRWPNLGPTDVTIGEDESAGGHGPSHTYTGSEPKSIGPGKRTYGGGGAAPGK